MQYLLFEIQEKTFGMDIANIVEIVPLVRLSTIPRVPEYIKGLINYRGTIIPVVDLSQLIADSPCKRFISTRIIVIKFFGADKKYHQLGLMAERVLETIKCTREKFMELGLNMPNAGYLGELFLHDDDNLVQDLDTDKLLSEEVQKLLFTAK